LPLNPKKATREIKVEGISASYRHLQSELEERKTLWIEKN